MQIGNAVGWSLAFLALVAMTDIPATAQVAAGLGWLVFIAVLVKYGAPAATNVSAIASTPVVASSSKSSVNITPQSTTGNGYSGGTSAGGSGGGGGF